MSDLPVDIDPGDPGHIEDHEDAHALLENLLAPFKAAGFARGTLGARPAAGNPGMLYHATDGPSLAYDDDGTWRSLLSGDTATTWSAPQQFDGGFFTFDGDYSQVGVDAGLLSARPAAGDLGRIYFATDTVRLYFDNGDDWVNLTTDDFYVDDFGADPTGATDSHEAFEAAAQAAHDAGGGRVVLTAFATYLIESSMVFEDLDDVLWVGNDAEVKVTADSQYNMQFWRHCNRITFWRVRWNGNWTTLDNTAANNRCMRYEAESTDLSVLECTFSNFTSTCISDRTQNTVDVGEASDVTVKRTLVRGNRFFHCDALYNTLGGGGRQILITDNHAYQCVGGYKIDGEITSAVDQEGEYASDPGLAIITHNTFHDHGDVSMAAGNTCIAVEELVFSVVIAHNIMDGAVNTAAIEISTGDNLTPSGSILIQGNVFRNIEGNNPVRIVNGSADSSVVLSDIAIVDNIASNLEAGFCFLKADDGGVFKNVLVARNIITDWATLDDGVGEVVQGIILRSTNPSTGVTIAHNKFLSTTSRHGNSRPLDISNGGGATTNPVVHVIGNELHGMTAAADAVRFGSAHIVSRGNYWGDGEVRVRSGAVVYSCDDYGRGGAVRIEDSGDASTVVLLPGCLFRKGSTAYAMRNDHSTGGAIYFQFPVFDGAWDANWPRWSADTASILGIAHNLSTGAFLWTSKPTVTGAKGGNAALASLLSGLATAGLITDSSTA